MVSALWYTAYTSKEGSMKAIVQERFGPPDVLRLVDTDVPALGAGDVLVRVHAAAVNPYDWHLVRGDPYVARLMGPMGLVRPKSPVAGIDAAGHVEAVGADVRGLRPGDEVLGFCPGSFAEYARATADLLVPKPAGLSYEQAAAVPMAAVTALRGIRTVGRVRSAQRVLVNGAAGGVGTFAVQIAAAMGAEVTGVCSARNVELVRSLGAAHVVDYNRADFTDRGVQYDVILDNVGNRPLRQLRRALTRTGTLVANGGGSPGHVFGAVGAMLRIVAANAVVRQRLRPILPAAPAGPTHDDLLAVTALIRAGTLTPVVGRTYSLPDAAEGVRQVEQGHARGKIVISVP
jgi:NADPH:quinone reductase-like Zn-dependent oxidoreductase